MGFSADLMPLAGLLPSRTGVYVAGGYSGVGNVQGYACGRLVADLIATGHHPDAEDVSPARFEHLSQPPERLEAGAEPGAGARAGPRRRPGAPLELVRPGVLEPGVAGSQQREVCPGTEDEPG